MRADEADLWQRVVQQLIERGASPATASDGADEVIKRFRQAREGKSQ